MNSNVAGDDTREEIMHATYLALCEHGYANLSMQDIANELGKSRSLLHYHYDTREELLLAFIDHLVGWIGDELEETDTEDPRTRLVEYTDRFVIEPDEPRRERFAISLFELRLQAVHNKRFREKLNEHYQGNVETAAEIIADGIEAGVFRPVDPFTAGEVIYTALEGARMYQVLLDAEGDSGRMRDAVIEYLVTDFVDVATVLDAPDLAGEEAD